jgi:hypothetical protein
MLSLVRQLQKNKTPAKYIRCDNAGENKILEKAIKDDPHLPTVKFEFTPRESPQYNGRCERKFAFLWNGVRAVLNSAKLPKHLRDGLWAEAARYVERVAKQLVTPSRKDLPCPYQQFHNKPWEPLPYLRPFGSIAIITTKKAIQGKQLDKGTPMIYLGPSDSHAKDVGRFFNPETKRVIVSKPHKWMGVMYGDWKNLKPSQEPEFVTFDGTPPESVETPPETPAPAAKDADSDNEDEDNTPNPRVLRAMKQLVFHSTLKPLILSLGTPMWILQQEGRVAKQHLIGQN